MRNMQTVLIAGSLALAGAAALASPAKADWKWGAFLIDEGAQFLEDCRQNLILTAPGVMSEYWNCTPHPRLHILVSCHVVRKEEYDKYWEEFYRGYSEEYERKVVKEKSELARICFDAFGSADQYVGGSSSSAAKVDDGGQETSTTTWKPLTRKPRPPLPSAAETRSVQEKLTACGLDPGPIDGLWGGKTAKAAAIFLTAQSSNYRRESPKSYVASVKAHFDSHDNDPEAACRAISHRNLKWAQTMFQECAFEPDLNAPDPCHDAFVEEEEAAHREEVRKAQAVLKKCGFDPGPVDGLWGRKTAEAAAAFIVAHDDSPPPDRFEDLDEYEYELHRRDIAEFERTPPCPPSAEEQEGVRQAQAVLKECGFDPGPVDGLWDQRTKAAAEDFLWAHRRRGSRWSPTELIVLVDSYRVGDAGPCPPSAEAQEGTRQVQAVLRQCGFDPGPIDGFWGDKTTTAAEAFVSARGGVPLSGRVELMAQVDSYRVGDAGPCPTDTSLQDLNGKDLAGADLAKADLSGKTLIGADLSSANLAEANLSDANLQGASLQGANLRGAKLERAKLTGADLSSANLTEAHLAGASLQGATLQDANLQGASLERAKLTSADLSSADLTGANLADTGLQGAVLKGARFKDAVLDRVKLVAADLSSADFSGARLAEASLQGASMKGTRFKDAVLDGAKLVGTDLRDTVMAGASLTGAALTSARFSLGTGLRRAAGPGILGREGHEVGAGRGPQGSKGGYRQGVLHHRRK